MAGAITPASRVSQGPELHGTAPLSFRRLLMISREQDHWQDRWLGVSLDGATMLHGHLAALLGHAPHAPFLTLDANLKT